MKNIGTILGALALVGVIYIGFFKDSGKTVPAKSSALANKDKGVRLAYVRSDSLQKQYKYFQDLSEELQIQEAKIQQEVERRQRDFQIEVGIYQESAAKMSDAQRQQSEADLMRVQQQHETWAREQSDVLMVRQQELQEKMKSDMDSVLVKMKDELALDFILLYDENGALIFANPEYDITETVVEKLNENYGKKKTEEK